MIHASSFWQQLEMLQQKIYALQLIDLFHEDKHRMKKYSVDAAGLHLDFSKNFINDAIFEALLGLTTEARLEQKIQSLFAGENINHTENKSAGHLELRKPLSHCNAQVIESRANLKAFVQALHMGMIAGATGKPITDIINIGIGGSDLGPKLACEALKNHSSDKFNFHFVANVDEYEINQVLKKINLETSLFIVASKSFSTIETLTNMQSAKAKFQHFEDQDAWKKHFVAVTARPDKALEAGFLDDYILDFCENVGGRYSLWSSVGLSIAVALGFEKFEAMLAGAHAMDEHFRQAEFHQNMPVILALLEIWYNNFWGSQSHAIIPYASQLNLLPKYLQQLVMESNGKAINSHSEFLLYDASPIIWGEVGTNCQHSFLQLFHQGLRLIPADFIVAMQTQGSGNHQQQLVANCFAQASVLMKGKNLPEAKKELMLQGLSETQAEALAPHRVLPGNNPSNMILMESISPETFGALISLYENKVFTSAMIWDINPFDQFGVEMGKVVASDLLKSITDPEAKHPNFDPSTNDLIQRYRKYIYEKA